GAVVGRVGRRDDGSLDEPGELDEAGVDVRTQTDGDPAGERGERARTEREPPTPNEQLPPIEPLTPGVRHRDGSVPREQQPRGKSSPAGENLRRTQPQARCQELNS